MPDRGGRPLAVIFDDQKMYAESFACMIEKTGSFRAVYNFVEEDSLHHFLMNQEGKSHICLFLDFYLKDKTSLSLLNDLKRLYRPLYIIVVSCVTNPILIKEILNYKIDGFISKFSDTQEIAYCIQSINNKQVYVSPIIEEMLVKFTAKETLTFSAREIEILHLLAQGLTVDDIAIKINLSRHTIVAHKRSLMTKSKTKTITELLAHARKIELI